MQPAVNANAMAQPCNGRIGRGPEKIDACNEENGIENAGNEDPLPQLMVTDETVRPEIGLDSNYNFFQQVD